jgi:hypothetical protein
MLNRERLDQLFALRAAAKADEQAMEKDFKAQHGFHPFDREAVAVAGMGWVADRWWELREGRAGLAAYEAAERNLDPEERRELLEMVELDYQVDHLDYILGSLEWRWLRHTH